MSYDLLQLVMDEEKGEELFQRIEQEFGIDFEPSEAESIWCTDRLIDAITGDLEERNALPEPRSGETADALYPVVLREAQAALAQSLSVNPEQIGPETELSRLAPSRKCRETFRLLCFRTEGDIFFKLSKTGWYVMFGLIVLVVLPLVVNALWHGNHPGAVVFGGLFWCCILAWLFNRFLGGYFQSCRFSTLSDYVEATAKKREKSKCEQQVARRIYHLLLSLLTKEDA